MKKLSHICTSVFFLFVLILNCNAQPIDRDKAISAYIYNFAKNVEWQNEEAIKEFHFLIIGQDENIIREMTAMSKAKKLRKRAIIVSSSATLKDINNVQLIFVTKGNEEQVVDIFDRIERKNILLVTDGYQDKNLIMINFLDSEKGTLGFEINKANIVDQQISIMPDMILLGGAFIDVAALYQEGQQSLRSRQKHIDSLNNNLTVLENLVSDKSREIKVNRDSLNRQTLKIKDQQSILNNQSQLLNRQQEKLETQIQKIWQQQSVYNIQSKELLTQKTELEKGNGLLQDQIIEINRQKSEIAHQKFELSSKSEVLSEQGSTIHRQRNLVYLLIIIIVLVVILVLTIFYAYKSKQKLNKELETRVRERTNDLNVLNEQLEDRVALRTKQLEAANKELEAFAYSVSHDLRAPLRAISGFTKILAEDYSEKIEEEGQRVCNVIQNETTRMGQLIDDLLAFSRLSRTSMQNSFTDMNELVKQVFEEIKKQYDNFEVDFQVEELLPGTFDQNLMRQVWVNLISNAFKFSSKKERIEIKVGCIRKENEVIYFIEDKGAGFDMKYADKLFGVFQRLHNMKEFQGTGVGLAIVQRIIHRHGGRVWAESEINKGAKFYFSLPIKI
jgi:signal transduction histidine kinase